MIDNNKNQKDKINDELIKSYEIGYIFENKPINRFKTKPTLEEKLGKLDNLKESIKMIEDCNLKSNAKNIVFNDGDINSPLMIVGEGPGQKEDEMGKPFVGDAGQLLDKMLKIKRTKLNGVLIIRPPTIFKDFRGFYVETYNEKIYKKCCKLQASK